MKVYFVTLSRFRPRRWLENLRRWPDKRRLTQVMPDRQGLMFSLV